jgi:hypothetical protein
MNLGKSNYFFNYFSNLHGNMESSLIMSIIGHLTKSLFLLYIDRNRIINFIVLEAIMITATK